MSDPHDKDKKPAAEEAAGTPKAAKGGMMVPLIAAAVISVGGSFGVGFFLNKQLLAGINKELTLALAQVGASEDHGDGHGAAKDPKAASGAHGADASHGKSSKTTLTPKHPTMVPLLRKRMLRPDTTHLKPRMTATVALRPKRRPPRRSPRRLKSRPGSFLWESTPSWPIRRATRVLW